MTMDDQQIKAATDAKRVLIDYTNHRGERSHRTISPIGISFEATTWHREPQWVLWALENKSGESVVRAFAIKDIYQWG